MKDKLGMNIVPNTTSNAVVDVDKEQSLRQTLLDTPSKEVQVVGGRVGIDVEVFETAVVVNAGQCPVLELESVVLVPVVGNEVDFHLVEVDGVGTFRKVVYVETLVQCGWVGGVVVHVHEVAVAEVELAEVDGIAADEVEGYVPSAVALRHVVLAVVGAVGDDGGPVVNHVDGAAGAGGHLAGVADEESVVVFVGAHASV